MSSAIYTKAPHPCLDMYYLLQDQLEEGVCKNVNALKFFLC